ncbi:hypothetical protein V8E36_006666, partial [Tilletia maclaganii]
DNYSDENKSPRPSIADSALSSRKSTASHNKSIQNIALRTRLANRIIDLRTPANLSIFRLQSALCSAFRAYLSDKGFMEIHTPKLQAAATESGSSVFKVDYFGRAAFLAQSPQLAKQMAISGDFGRVFEIGPVFCAENSNTHRHLTEYTGCDIEMAITNDYHEVMHLIDATLRSMFAHIYKHHRRELDVVKASYPHEDLVWLDTTPVLRFDEAVRLLNDSGWTDDEGNQLKEDEDLGTRDEIRLGQLMKEKYATDYFIIDKFPASVRPFYTMPDQEDAKWTNSFDFFCRGQEILTGGQRIHQLKKLESAMVRNGVQPEDMKDYCEAFQFGAPAHGGAGIGLERLLMLILKLGDIRNASLLPRDPQSLPTKPPQTSLRFPEASTLHPPWERGVIESGDPLANFDDDLDEDEVEGILREGGTSSVGPGGYQTPDNAAKQQQQNNANLGQLQPLGKLIANYGSSTSTALLDDRYRVWRHAESGAAVSYVPVEKFAVVVGNPLCDASQYGRVIRHLLSWLKRETRLKPIWLLVDGRVEAVLAQDYGWSTLSCIAEERASTTGQNPAFHDAEVQRRVRHAEREGVKIVDACALGGDVDREVIAECEEGMKTWLAGRKGKQAHLTQLNPWRDMEHRHYSIARDREGKIVALVVLAILSKAQGFQVKYALDWEPAPSGTIEAITLHAVKAAASLGAQSVTFGAGAAATIEAGHNMGGIQAAALRRTYKSIVASRGLARKTAFRAKMGADDSAPEDRLWVTYPKGGLGARGIRALLTFFGDPVEEEEEEEGDILEDKDEASAGEATGMKDARGRGSKRSSGVFGKLPFGGGGGSSSKSPKSPQRVSQPSVDSNKPVGGGRGDHGRAASSSRNGSESRSASGEPAKDRNLSATSKAQEDVESCKQQIVHSTRAVQAESADASKEPTQPRGTSSATDQATASNSNGNGTSSTRSRGGNGSTKIGAEAHGKKQRLSGLFNHVFHRQNLERNADVNIDQPQPPPKITA